ncbi:hypothetical protein PG993_000349 [Apiospora rasikravindrae]|uniref:F-box domain-containing protein n=1 Tax=Apiospora rasikravindrae TaxID=990691 RepID=A0ABR1U8B0_9PEZI
MQLTNLPPELLREILSHLLEDDATGREYADHGQPSLCALALTGARGGGLAEVAAGLLYGAIQLERNGDGARDEQRMVLLNRSCRANPQLVHRIRSADIRWFHSVDATPHYEEFLAHLARSRSLVSLDAQFGYPPPLTAGCPLPALFQWQPGSFAALRKLHVQLDNVDHGARVPVAFLVRLCELPSLQDVTICAPAAVDHDDDDDDNDGGGGDEQHSSCGTSSEPLPKLGLTEMYFGCGRPVSSALLRQVLPRAPALKTLSLDLPGAAVEVDRKMCNDVSSGGYDLKGPLFSPRSIGRLLAPAAASLEQMDLVANNVYLPAQHDGSQIDLSAFTRLRHLEITACLLFGAGRGSVRSSGDDIWPCLPPALEKLTIVFDTDLGLFWSLAEMREHTRSGTFASQLWDRRLRQDGDGLRWLAALLRRLIDGDQLGKQLRRGEVVDRDRNWALATWREPGGDRMMDLARAAAVELEVSLRVPRRFRSEEIDIIEEADCHGKPGTVSYGDEAGEGPSSTASPGSQAGMDDDW